MKEHPILFSSPMVRAILEGRKTQTRRIIQPQQPLEGDGFHCYNAGGDEWFYQRGEMQWNLFKCPYGSPGDRLWVRENIYYSEEHFNFYYQADSKGVGQARFEILHALNYRGFDNQTDFIIPSIHIPRVVSRINLEIINIRVERVQEISEEDAKAEGALHHDGCSIGHSGFRHDINHGFVYTTARESFSVLWDSINGKKYPWSSNPWVWVIEFRRV